MKDRLNALPMLPPMVLLFPLPMPGAYALGPGLPAR